MIEVDKTKWHPAVDKKGRPIAPGDYVSTPTYPRGTVRGYLKLSDNAWTVDGDKNIGALLVVDDQGESWGPVTVVTLLKRKE